MTLQFTQNAVNRYIQFHMLDVVDPDPRDVRELLERHAPEAIKIPEKTQGGQTLWRIEALGCQLVSKHDGGFDVVVTILPPYRFRGLTPLQVEKLATDHAQQIAADERLKQEYARSRQEDRAAAVQEQEERDRVKTLPAEMSKLAKQIARQNLAARLDRQAELKLQMATAQFEREILTTFLRSARHQLNRDGEIATLTRALRAVLRQLRDRAQRSDGLSLDEVRYAFSQVEAVEARLVTNAFIDEDE